MEYSQHSHRVDIDLDKIRGNYRFLCAASHASGVEKLTPAVLPRGQGANGASGREREFPWPRLIAVVKADAYGHGHIRVARCLMQEGATLFASGTVREAVSLAQALAHNGDDQDTPPVVIALLGVMNDEDVRLAVEHGIIPVIHCFEQLSLLEKLDLPLAVALKCNTGMNRLGFDSDGMDDLLRALDAMPKVRPVLALSHLASADSEQGKQAVHSQGTVFAAMLQTLRKKYPGLAASLANTAGTLLSSEIEAAMGPHICRPGIGLYGGNPFAGTTLENLGQGLTPAMSVNAPLMAVRDLPMGFGVGYGHTFRATRNMRVGIIAAGYSDMFPRLMSNHGEVCINGQRARILGRVSMQMSAVDLENCGDAAAGDQAWLLGGPYDAAVSVEELASLWQSISYEVFCLLGHGHRQYR